MNNIWNCQTSSITNQNLAAVKTGIDRNISMVKIFLSKQILKQIKPIINLATAPTPPFAMCIEVHYYRISKL